MPANVQLIDRLRQIPYFSHLDEPTLRLLAGKMVSAEYEPSQDLCREGERADRMFILESGEVAVFRPGKADVLVEIAVLQPGDVAGATSLFSQGRRSATLRARTPVRAWVLDHPTFQELFDQHPSVARALLASLSQQLAQGGAMVAHLLSQDFDPRYRVVVYDAKSYTEAFFRERNRHDYLLQFIGARLSLETVALAAGSKVVCAFVNDTLDEAVLKELRGAGVELVAMRCAGYNNVDLAACARLGLTVVRVPAYSPHAVAEHTVALMLTLNRRVHRAHNRVREGNFSLDGLVGFDFYGKTAGIVGTGKIGRCVTEILAGFGCRLLAYDRYPDPALAERLGLRYVTLDEIFAESDVITLHTPLVPETKHLINADAIAKMKSGVMIINTSRGALIDTQALLAGLKRGQIGHAGLDVYEEESDYFFEDYSDRVMTDDLLARLTTFNNVVVTSHQAFLTREALTNIADTTLENIREYQVGRRGSQLTNLVRVG